MCGFLHCIYLIPLRNSALFADVDDMDNYEVYVTSRDKCITATEWADYIQHQLRDRCFSRSD